MTISSAGAIVVGPGPGPTPVAAAVSDRVAAVLRSVVAAVAGFEEHVVVVVVVAVAAAAVVFAATTWLSVPVPAAKLRSNPATRHLVAAAVVVAVVGVSRAISIDLGECW